MVRVPAVGRGRNCLGLVSGVPVYIHLLVGHFPDIPAGVQRRLAVGVSAW